MSADHEHGSAATAQHAGARYRGRMLASFVLIGGFFVVELVGGLMTNSLALLSDAGHMFTDSSSLAIGALAAWMAKRPVSKMHSFGLQRAEVLGALINAVLMIVVVVAIAVSAIQRFAEPRSVAGAPVMIIAAIGLLMNIGVAVILMRGEQTMNVRGALIHVIGDLLGSVAALAAGLIIILTGWMPIDPLLSLLVSVLILVSAVRLLRDRRMTVALWGSADLDVRDVDLRSLRLGPDEAPARSLRRARRFRRRGRDLNGDGYPDLRLRFHPRHSGLQSSDTEVCLTGRLHDGTALRGCDRSVRIVDGRPRRARLGRWRY